MAKRYVEEFVQWRHPYQWLWANAAARSAQTVDAGDLWKRGLQMDTLVEYFLTDDSPVTWTAFSGGGGTGDVVGPASATNSNLAAFDGTTGKLIKDSGKAYPTGTIVGTSDTQTLTNKSIAGSQITGSFTGFGATLATSRILGRSTAGTGAVEEISIGSGLSLSAGVLSATGGGGSGTVTSVAMTVPGILSVAGSPITTSGTLAISLANQNANLAFMGPTTGSPAAPTFRALVAADFPSNTIALSSIANIATARMLGRTTAGSGAPEELTAAQAQTVMALDVNTTELGAIARSRVRKNSTGTVFKRRQLNFIEGSNITITVADDSTDEEVDITIAASGGGGGSPTKETPSGSINGSNVTFTLTATPTTLLLYLNGVLQDPGAGNDYTISTNTITMATAPATGEKLCAVFW